MLCLYRSRTRTGRIERERQSTVPSLFMAVVQNADDRVRASQVKRDNNKQARKEKLFNKKTSIPADPPQKHTTGYNPQKRRKRSVGNDSAGNNVSEALIIAYQRAKEVQANLSPEFPSLVKCMLPSHVSGGFWLGLPSNFCHLHLPNADVVMALEDESGEIYETKYLAAKLGLSGGWRGFSLAHKLLEMDVLIFHLVQPYKFKVYIMRSKGSDEVDGALGLLNLYDRGTQKDALSLEAATDQGKNSRMTFEVNFSESAEQHQGLEGIRASESVVRFEQVTDFENFSIQVNGLVIDSELPKYVRTEYYELCRSQGSFLHEHLLEGLNCKLVAGMISETINIADAIKASKITNSSVTQSSFVTWEKTLKAFEAMGMNVSFLISRLDQLTKLALKVKRYREARLERELAEENLKSLQAKLVEVKQIINRLDEEINQQYPNSERLDSTFQELVNAPW